MAREDQDLHWIPVTLFATGAAVMAVEILGARVLGPHFGASLYVWTALIAVTLLALAAGYRVGGSLADRPGASADGFFAIVAIAGALLLLVPVVRVPVLLAARHLGIRGGAVASGLVLFFPCLFALGCATPYGTRLATRSLESVGSSVGRLYAISTVGSFLGALGTGFFLIPTFGVATCLTATGASLLLLALVARRRWLGKKLGLLGVLVLTLGVGHAVFARNRTPPPGLVCRVSGAYGDLRVVDHAGARYLLVDGITQTRADLATGLSTSVYVETILSRVRLARPEAKTALVLGLGGAALARAFTAQEMRTDAVEIDPDVVSVARRFFGYDPGQGEVRVEDARTFIASPPRRYDVATLDVFCGERVPFHLMSQEAFLEIKDRVLTTEGILAINFVGFDGTKLSPGGAALRTTLSSVFPHVRVYPAQGTVKSSILNVVFLASASPLEPAPGEVTDLAPGVLVTDDWNPLDTLDEETRTLWREGSLASMPPEVVNALLAD